MIDDHTFEINKERAQDYLNTRQRIYVTDGFAGWDPNHRLKVRIIASRRGHYGPSTVPIPRRPPPATPRP